MILKVEKSYKEKIDLINVFIKQPVGSMALPLLK